jgi:hypothetical protein
MGRGRGGDRDVQAQPIPAAMDPFDLSAYFRRPAHQRAKWRAAAADRGRAGWSRSRMPAAARRRVGWFAAGQLGRTYRDDSANA